jgi:hypothetical protein
MPFDAPFKLGPFEVDSHGRLSPFDPAEPPAFLFRWRGRAVHARLTQADATTGLLSLQVTLGRVPSTAVAGDDTLRPRSFALLHWLTRSVPPGWRMCLLADHRIWLETETRIGLPITAPALVTDMTCFALDLQPYLELLEETGITG